MKEQVNKIAFWGVRETFDYFHISGFQSLVRRISLELIRKGIEVDYVMYGAEKSQEIEVRPNLRLRYFVNLKEAFDALCTFHYDHIVNVRLCSYWDRLKTIFLNQKLPSQTKYHYFSLGWPDSVIKRYLRFTEAILVSRKGRIICVSPRLFRALGKWVKNAY